MRLCVLSGQKPEKRVLNLDGVIIAKMASAICHIAKMAKTKTKTKTKKKTKTNPFGVIARGARRNPQT